MRSHADPTRLLARQLSAARTSGTLAAHEVSLLQAEIVKLKRALRLARMAAQTVNDLILTFVELVPGERVGEV